MIAHFVFDGATKISNPSSFLTNRTLTAALQAVDDHLSGRKVKKLDGFEIFVATKAD